MVVFAEYTWTPGDLVQAEDRAHRIGQASSVNIYMLHVKGSIDDLIWQKLQRKLEHVGQVMLDIVFAWISAEPVACDPCLMGVWGGGGGRSPVAGYFIAGCLTPCAFGSL